MIGPAPSTAMLNDLVDQLRADLNSAGTAIADVDTLAVPVDLWRKAARRAGTILNRPIRTVTHGNLVQAYLVDWPANPDEQRVHDRAFRSAVERAAGPAAR